MNSLVPIGSWVVLLGVSFTADDVVWVNELENNSELIGKEIVVEGRFSGRVGANLNQIRLHNLSPDKIEFRLGTEVERFPSSMQWIRLTGTLTESGGKLVMRVSTWAKISTTDEDRYRELALRIGRTDHRAWYALADRVLRLADFYGERELRSLAGEARRQGFRAEEAALRPDQADQLLKLAERAAGVGLDSDDARRMRHKGLRWKLETLKEAGASAGQWSRLAEQIATLLPGATTPLQAPDPAMLRNYDAKPIELYDSMPKQREAFDRSFWIDATAQYLALEADQPNADVRRLAAEAGRRIPERPDLARTLLKKWADAEAIRLAKWAEAEATRTATQPPASQVRKLAEIFRTELVEPQRAQQVLRLWLDTRRKRLSTRDADGRVRLARDYRADLRDDENAARLLLEAVAIEPDLPEAVTELKLLGIVKSPSGWVRSDQAPRAGGNAARQRLPTEQMTKEQVKEILGEPRPEESVRFTDRDKDGKRRVIEQWTYRGPPDIHITFQVVSASESLVIAISTQSQK